MISWFKKISPKWQSVRREVEGTFNAPNIQVLKPNEYKKVIILKETETCLKDREALEKEYSEKLGCDVVILKHGLEFVGENIEVVCNIDGEEITRAVTYCDSIQL